MRNFQLAAFSAMMIFFLASSGALAQQIGVLGLFNVDKSASAAVDELKIDGLNCQLRREGMIVGEDGDIGINEPNWFVFLACEDSLLGDPAKRRLLSHLIVKGESLAILEGVLTDIDVAHRAGAVADRQYILKVSHYNNRDADARERDLERVNKAAVSLPDAYVTESFISVNRAQAMPTPDEAIIIYYDNPGQGDRFRNNNPVIMDMISKFNKTHLDASIYFVGKATR